LNATFQAAVLLVSLLCVCKCFLAQTVIEQSPRYIAKLPEEKAEMSCTLSGTSSPYLYWYRQHGSGEMEFLFFSRGKGMFDDSPVKDFIPERKEDLFLSLRTDSLRVNHTAVYYCAWSRHS
uniref:Ig-like domain-containing protein n=1 Tax=Lepisosteus oculatus TaxID=7918 RepID=W5N780_LEPOC